jgi:prepilin-type N-terminal cleavage/methylation domain-containing protein
MSTAGRPRSQAAFTLVELLVVLAVVGVVGGLGVTRLVRPRPDILAANLQAAMQRARVEAVQRNRPVALVYDTTTQVFTTRVKGTATATGCAAATGDSDAVTTGAADTPRLSVTSTMPADASAASLSGVLWQPSGLPTRCNGTTFTGGTFTIAPTTGGTAVLVTVNANGRVVTR